MEYILFVKDLYGQPVDKITPMKKRPTLMSPTSKGKLQNPDLLASQSYRKRLMSPDSQKTAGDSKIKHSTDLFY